jgi:hypothetical protein
MYNGTPDTREHLLCTPTPQKKYLIRKKIYKYTSVYQEITLVWKTVGHALNHCVLYAEELRVCQIRSIPLDSVTHT